MATILTFATHAHPATTPRGDMRGEVIVFPRTDVHALSRLSAAGTERPPAGDGDTAPPASRDPA